MQSLCIGAKPVEQLVLDTFPLREDQRHGRQFCRTDTLFDRQLGVISDQNAPLLPDGCADKTVFCNVHRLLQKTYIQQPALDALFDTEAQIDKMRQIQDALLAQIDYMRTIGADQTDINALAAEYWQINQDINQLLEERQEAAWKELEDYVDGLLEKAQQVRDEQLAAIDDQIDALKKRKEEENEQLTLEEKRLAVQKAMEDLANARNERTIRQIQADGSWEWVADASNVQSAEDALQAAKDDLAEYEKELAYNAVIDALEAQKAMIEAEYDAFEDQWEAIKDSIEQPSEDIAEILQEIADVGAPAMQNAISSVTNMLDGLANYIGMTINTGPVSGVDGLNGGILGGAGSGGLTLGGRYDSATDYLEVGS